MSERHWLIQFDDQQQLVEAAAQAGRQQLRVIDAFAPYPIEALQELVAGPVTRTSWLIFLGGLLGATAAFTLCTWSAVLAYPFRVGGTPYFSWPAFLPITFECGVLLAALTGFFSLWLQSGLPRYHHPLFDHLAFREASYKGYLLLLECEHEQARALGGVLHAE